MCSCSCSCPYSSSTGTALSPFICSIIAFPAQEQERWVLPLSMVDNSVFSPNSLTIPNNPCAGYLGYPFKNQEVNNPARNLNATYLMQKLQRKRKGRSIISALFWNG
jgi:hypothetical protein